MLSRKYIQESEKEYQYMISELKEKVSFFTNKSQRLEKENKKLKEQLERREKARLKCLNKIKILGKFDGEKCTRSFTLWSADFNELVKMLDIDKGE